MARQRSQLRFDPYAILAALEQERTTYILIGAFARVLVGADEITRGIDLTPSTREENLRRLDLALEHIRARRLDGTEPALQTTDYGRDPVIELPTDHGEVKVIPFPEGTRGYDDLRRDAERRCSHDVAPETGSQCGFRSPQRRSRGAAARGEDDG